VDMRLHIVTEIDKEREKFRKVSESFENKLKDAQKLIKSYRNNCIQVTKIFNKHFAGYMPQKKKEVDPVETLAVVGNLLEHSQIDKDGVIKRIGEMVKTNEAALPTLKKRKSIFLDGTNERSSKKKA